MERYVVKLSDEETEKVVDRIKDYFIKELDSEIGRFDAEFLIEFFGKEIGRYYYNKGLRDAEVVIESALDSAKEALYGMEDIS